MAPPTEPNGGPHLPACRARAGPMANASAATSAAGAPSCGGSRGRPAGWWPAVTAFGSGSRTEVAAECVEGRANSEEWRPRAGRHTHRGGRRRKRLEPLPEHVEVPLADLLSQTCAQTQFHEPSDDSGIVYGEWRPKSWSAGSSSSTSRPADDDDDDDADNDDDVDDHEELGDHDDDKEAIECEAIAQRPWTLDHAATAAPIPAPLFSATAFAAAPALCVAGGGWGGLDAQGLGSAASYTAFAGRLEEFQGGGIISIGELLQLLEQIQQVRSMLFNFEQRCFQNILYLQSMHSLGASSSVGSAEGFPVRCRQANPHPRSARVWMRRSRRGVNKE